MSSSETIAIHLRQWTPEYAAQLRLAAGASLPLLGRQVRDGIAHLWECVKDDKVKGLVVTRFDFGSTGRELVIVAAEGQDLFDDFAPLFVEYCRTRGIGLRTHVRRKGLIRMWARLGVELDEYVLRLPPGENNH